MRDFDVHPDEELLEQYAMGRLRGRLLGRVEQHLLVCEACRERLGEAEEFARATRLAAGVLRNIPLDFTHDSEDGPIRLRAEKTEQGDWLATFCGQQLQGAERFKTVAEANEFLLESFRSMFPEHECTEGCGRSEGLPETRLPPAAAEPDPALDPPIGCWIRRAAG